MLTVLAVAFASALPAQAQLFRQAMTDSVYEQNIPRFREMGLMPPTGMNVNLDVVADVALEMATSDGSLKTLPEAFRSADTYKLRFRTVNGLTDRTMPLDQFRALVNGRGIRLLRPSDFEAVSSAPIVSTPPVAKVTSPVSLTSQSPARTVTPADTARIRGLEQRVAAAESAAKQGQVTPAQLAELQALRAELNQAKADIGSLTKTGTALDKRIADVEGAMITDAELTDALAGKADKADAGVPWWGWVLIGAALFIGIATYGRLLRTNKRVSALETDAEDGAEHRFGIAIYPDDMEEILSTLPEGETFDVRVEFDGNQGSLRLKKVGKDKVTTTQIRDQTQAMNIKTLRSTIKRHIGAGRVTLIPFEIQLHSVAA